MWDKLNSLGKDRKPFLFISDFEAKELHLFPIDELEKHDIEYCIDENYKYKSHPHFLKKKPIDFEEYKQKFDYIQENKQFSQTKRN